VPNNLDDIKWKSLAPGIKHYAISDLQTDGGSLFMLNIAPGTKIPEHGHNGIELTQVLKGSFSDAAGCFNVGDIVDLDDDVEHQPIVGSDESCICLIASQAPLRFTGLVPRLVHYFSGM
jgi:putative transcriptional regulator